MAKRITRPQLPAKFLRVFEETYLILGESLEDACNRVIELGGRPSEAIANWTMMGNDRANEKVIRFPRLIKNPNYAVEKAQYDKDMAKYLASHGMI